MKLNTDNTARLVVLMLCVSIVIMRLLKPSITFDACSLGALAVAGLVAIAPVWRGGTANTHGEGPSADKVDALRARTEAAGLLMAESHGAYAALKDTRPVSLALSGARATLALRLKSLTDQARLDARYASADSSLAALNSAGITTDDQHAALKELMRLLESAGDADTEAGVRLLDIAIRVIEMLDGTLE